MRIKLFPSTFGPTVDDYHKFQPGTGWFSFRGDGSGHTKFWADVKLEDGRLGSILIPTEVVTNNLTNDSDAFEGDLIYRKAPTFFGNFNLYNKLSYEDFITKRLKAVEEWLQTPEADQRFREMCHCSANKYFGPN